MQKLKERETPSQNIAFLGIMAGVCVVFSLISSFVPFVTIFAMFILSIASSLGTRLTKIKYSIPFMIATSAIMIAVSFFNFIEVLLYLVPAVLCGGLYGILNRLKAPTTYMILASSYLSMVLSIIGVYIIEAITGLNPIETTISLLGLESYENIKVAYYGLLLGIGLVQMTLSHFLIVLLHGRLQLTKEKDSPLGNGIGALVSGILSLTVGLFVLEVGYVFLVTSIYLFILSVFDIVLSKKKILYILSIVFLVVGVFLIALLTPLLITQKAILLGAYYPVVSGLLLILFSIKKNASLA